MKVIDFADAPAEGKKAVLLFWAPWHEDSDVGGSWDAVLRALAESTADDTTSNIQFGRVHAEDCPMLIKKYDVKAVPTFVLLNTNGQVYEKIEGGEDVSLVTNAVQRLIQQATTTGSGEQSSIKQLSAEEQLSQRLDRLIRSSEVMLFMKGAPDAPRCGFSRQAVSMLQDESIPFGSFDILSDETVRQGLKKHSNWPTYPQLYVNGELVGGLDIMKETKEEGSSLKEGLGITSSTAAGAAAAPKSSDDKYKQLIEQQPIMLFMKGLPSAPRCGFSQKIVEILDGEDVAYGAFNILEDEEVRQGLKKYSDWPTYPQLYVKGELIGGLDIVKEMKEDGTLKETLKG